MLKRIISIFTFAFIMCSAVYGFELLDTNAVTSLEVKYEFEDINISGTEFSLYKVAEVSEYVEYTVTEQFSGYAISFNDLGGEGGRALAQTLKAYADRDDLVPLNRGTTDDNGSTKFTGLKTGLYLVTAPSSSHGGYTYTPEPFLICLPNYIEEKWVNDVTATPKVSREKVPGSGGGGGSPPSPKINMGVLKVWEEDDEAKRPDSVEVQLIRNGMVYHTAVLNENNNWHYTWEDLPDYGDYEVTEKTVSDGYTVSVTREGDAFIVKNTGPGTPEKEPTTEATTEEEKEPETEPHNNIVPPPSNPNPPVINEPVIPDNTEPATEDPYGSTSGSGGRTNAWSSRQPGDDPNVPGLPGSSSGSGSRSGSAAGSGLPQTGQLWWPVPILSSFGAILFLLGFIRHKEQELKLSSKN